ncbi:MAG: Flp family type IVb pilin [bacterium]
MNKLLIFLNQEDGVTAIEYGLIAALIVVAIMASLRSLSSSVSGLYALFQKLANAMH